MSYAAGIGATQALTQQAIALSVVKAAADANQKMADMLAQMVENLPVAASGRGAQVDIAA